MRTKIFETRDHKGVFSLFGYMGAPSLLRVGAGCALISGLLLAGCGGDQPREDADRGYYTDQSQSVFSSEPPPPPPQDQGMQDKDRSVLMQGDAGSNRDEPLGGWSIILTKLNGAGIEKAQELLKVIQTEAGLRQAFIEQRSEGLVIAYGNYHGRDEAIKDLERVKKTKLLSATPFENAIIAPPSSTELRGSNPMYDLRSVKQRYGEQAVYTLQIGLYGRVDYQSPAPEELAAYRRAAEEAVRDLRAQGELAFYYHAPARSMVTVGVFGERDFDNTTLPPLQSPRLKATREKFPNNLVNGAGLNETLRTETGKMKRLQSSQLVAIPEK